MQSLFAMPHTLEVCMRQVHKKKESPHARVFSQPPVTVVFLNLDYVKAWALCLFGSSARQSMDILGCI